MASKTTRVLDILSEPDWSSPINRFQARLIRKLREVGVADCVIYLALEAAAAEENPR